MRLTNFAGLITGSAAAALLAFSAPAKALSNGPANPPDFERQGQYTPSDWDLIDGTQKTVKTKVASLASWYGPGFHGNRTANGERYNQWDFTAAHRSLPFGTRVKVTNLSNGRSVVVRVNDDGPHVPGRVIDLSRGAAERIGMVSSGVAPVRLQVLR